jgi:signal transduction histidine kinase
VTVDAAQVLLGAVCVSGALAWGLYVRARRLLLASLLERAQRAEAEQELRVQQARHLERARIAREIHDVLAHRISLLSLHAGALELRPTAPPETIASAAGVIRSSAHQVLEDLREVIGVLRVDQPDEPPERPQPDLAGLEALAAEARAAGGTVTLDNAIADPAAVPATIGRAAYRIVQEGLTNARKHAPGRPVTVTAGGAPGEGLTVEVRNPLSPGGARAAIPGGGTGLIGLAERAAIAGGRLEHGATAGGFRLAAWLPWSVA